MCIQFTDLAVVKDFGDVGHHILQRHAGVDLDMHSDGVALSVLGLQVLGRAQTHEAAVDHDGQLRAQEFTLLHAGYRQGG